MASLIYLDTHVVAWLYAGRSDLLSDVARALGLSWTRDPFDRLIVAQADLAEAPLVTKDETIREHYPRATWAG